MLGIGNWDSLLLPKRSEGYGYSGLARKRLKTRRVPASQVHAVLGAFEIMNIAIFQQDILPDK